MMEKERMGKKREKRQESYLMRERDTHTDEWERKMEGGSEL